jgi:hypothetical protein
VEELLQSPNQQWIKVSEKRGLYRLVVQDKVTVREAAVKTVQNPDTVRMLTQTPCVPLACLASRPTHLTTQTCSCQGLMPHSPSVQLCQDW